MNALDLLPADLVKNAVPIVGGWHIKDLDDGHCVDVMKMAYNYRLVLSQTGHMLYDHGWCYFGHGEDENGLPRTMSGALLRAMAAAITYDGTGNPDGYDKQAC